MKARIFSVAVFAFVLAVFLIDLQPQWVNHKNVIDQKLNNVALINDASAMIVGERGTVLFTNDRGASWSTKKLATNHALNGISVVQMIPNKLRIDEEDYASYIVGDGGKIFKLYKRVTDLSVDSDFNLKDVTFRNSVQGIAVGEKFLMYDTESSVMHPAYASILTTFDGGKTWKENSFNVRAKFNSVVYIDKELAIAVGDKGLFAITNDGGRNWELKNLNCSENFNKIKFCTSDVGVIVGDNSTLFITSDAGNVWTNISIKAKGFYNMKGVCSRDHKTLTVVGEGAPEAVEVGKKVTEGVIMETADYGKTWSQVLSDQRGLFNNIQYCGKAFGVAVGDKGALAVYTYEKQLIDLHDLTAFRPKLNNNYPNPFNPSTRISYLIKHADNVRISILNALGEEVSVLVNEEKTPGIYEVEFNADNLTSGVYFYRIQSGPFSETKKMLLVR